MEGQLILELLGNAVGQIMLWKGLGAAYGFRHPWGLWNIAPEDVGEYHMMLINMNDRLSKWTKHRKDNYKRKHIFSNMLVIKLGEGECKLPNTLCPATVTKSQKYYSLNSLFLFFLNPCTFQGIISCVKLLRSKPLSTMIYAMSCWWHFKCCRKSTLWLI